MILVLGDAAEHPDHHAPLGRRKITIDATDLPPTRWTSESHMAVGLSLPPTGFSIKLLPAR
eukprot:11149894-Alexandrium_andersonii.AAC.1